MGKHRHHSKRPHKHRQSWRQSWRQQAATAAHQTSQQIHSSQEPDEARYIKLPAYYQQSSPMGLPELGTDPASLLRRMDQQMEGIKSIMGQFWLDQESYGERLTHIYYLLRDIKATLGGNPASGSPRKEDV